MKTICGQLMVYCEMFLDNGGYTFVSNNSLSLNYIEEYLNEIFTDKYRFLLRTVSTNQIAFPQSYTLAEQLVSEHPGKQIELLANRMPQNYVLNLAPFKGYSSYFYLNLYQADYMIANAGRKFGLLLNKQNYSYSYDGTDSRNILAFVDYSWSVNCSYKIEVLITQVSCAGFLYRPRDLFRYS